MCDCPSQSPSPEKPGGHQPSQPASRGSEQLDFFCTKHWCHTHKTGKQKTRGTACRIKSDVNWFIIIVSCLIGGCFKPVQINNLGDHHHYSLYTYSVNVLCALLKLTCLGYCAMYADPRVALHVSKNRLSTRFLLVKRYSWNSSTLFCFLISHQKVLWYC